MPKLLEALGDKELKSLERVNVMLYRGQLRWLDEFIATYNARARDENAKGGLRARRSPINRSHVLRFALTHLKDHLAEELDKASLKPMVYEFTWRRPPPPTRTKVMTPPPSVEELRAARRARRDRER
ncbi:MAG TPA: hypothetical protein VGM51_01840 [Armatimonadota bacterium]|jgi:hypothetical protein